MKKLILTLLALALPVVCEAGTLTLDFGTDGAMTTVSHGTTTITYIHSTAGTYADITFYDKLDDPTSGRPPTKGFGTLSISANISTVAALGGTSLAATDCSVGVGFRGITATQTTNIDLSVGAAGFYISVDTATDNNTRPFGFVNAVDSDSKFRFEKGTDPNVWTFRYEDVAVSKTLLSDGTTYYVELAWDHSKANGFCARIRVDNGAWSSNNSCTEAVPVNTSAAIFGIIGYANAASSLNGRMDEILISNRATRDLYAIRDVGYYPD